MKIGEMGQYKVEYALVIALVAVLALGVVLLALSLGWADGNAYLRATFGG